MVMKVFRIVCIFVFFSTLVFGENYLIDGGLESDINY